MITINFNIADDKVRMNYESQLSNEDRPSPMEEDTDNLGIAENIPTPQSFEQEIFSSVDRDDVPQPENFLNIQNSDDSFIPSPVEEESFMNLESSEEVYPEPMNFEELNEVKDTKKMTKTTTSRSKKK